MGSKNPTKRDVSLFESLLFCDTFRGPHSTGVFAQRTYKLAGLPDKTVYPFAKLAVTGPEFLDTAEWAELRDGTTVSAKYANFYVGHNRYATVGAINAVNAHPFRSNKITMVHNGTLLDQKLLPDHANFEVDSANVCHSLDKWGVDKTIQNLDGAFTLIWHNREDHTLHVIRNDERPFHFIESNSGDWFGASEEDMLMWILRRGKLKTTIKRHFEAEVGVEYVFDVSPGKFELKEERKHELPSFYAGWGASTRASGYVPNNSRTRRSAGYNGNVPLGTSLGPSEKKFEGVHTVMARYDVNKKVNDIVEFSPYEFEPYTSGGRCTGKGKLLGYIPADLEYIEVQSHGVLSGAVEVKATSYIPTWGKIVGAFDQGGFLTLVVTDLTQVKPEDDSSNTLTYEEIVDDDAVPFEVDGNLIDRMSGETIEPDEELKVLNGIAYTQSQWADQSLDCGNCSSPIQWEELDDCAEYLGSTLCPNCVEEVFDEVADTIDEYERNSRTSTFVCGGCSETLNTNLEHPTYKNTCVACVETFFPHTNDKPVIEGKVSSKTSVVLSNGIMITKEHWNSAMSTCKCGAHMHWEAATHLEMRGGVCICEACSNKLNAKEDAHK